MIPEPMWAKPDMTKNGKYRENKALFDPKKIAKSE